MLSSSLILSKILSRCPHCFNFDGIATSSLPTSKYFLVYTSGSSTQSSEPFLLLATFSPLTTDNLLATSPLSVFMVIDFFLPFMPNLLSNLSKLKVPGYSYSKVHRFFRVSPESPSLDSTGTTQIIITSMLPHYHFSPHLPHCYTGVDYCQLFF